MSSSTKVEKEYKALSKELIVLMKQRSSGNLSYRELRRRRYPYAEAKPAPFLMFANDPSYINVHSNDFRKSWVVQMTWNGFKIKNISSHANKLFDGIPGLTIPRPILTSPSAKKAIGEVEKRCVKRMAEALADDLVIALEVN